MSMTKNQKRNLRRKKSKEAAKAAADQEQNDKANSVSMIEVLPENLLRHLFEFLNLNLCIIDRHNLKAVCKFSRNLISVPVFSPWDDFPDFQPFVVKLQYWAPRIIQDSACEKHYRAVAKHRKTVLPGSLRAPCLNTAFLLFHDWLKWETDKVRSLMPMRVLVDFCKDNWSQLVFGSNGDIAVRNIMTLRFMSENRFPKPGAQYALESFEAFLRAQYFPRGRRTPPPELRASLNKLLSEYPHTDDPKLDQMKIQQEIKQILKSFKSGVCGAKKFLVGAV